LEKRFSFVSLPHFHVLQRDQANAQELINYACTSYLKLIDCVERNQNNIQYIIGLNFCIRAYNLAMRAFTTIHNCFLKINEVGHVVDATAEQIIKDDILSYFDVATNKELALSSQCRQVRQFTNDELEKLKDMFSVEYQNMYKMIESELNKWQG